MNNIYLLEKSNQLQDKNASNHLTGRSMAVTVSLAVARRLVLRSATD